VNAQMNSEQQWQSYHRQEDLNTRNKRLKYQCKCTCQGLSSTAVDVLTQLFYSVNLLLVETTVVLCFGHCNPSSVFWSQGYWNTNKFFSHMFLPFIYWYTVRMLQRPISYIHRQGLCSWLVMPIAFISISSFQLHLKFWSKKPSSISFHIP